MADNQTRSLRARAAGFAALSALTLAPLGAATGAVTANAAPLIAPNAASNDTSVSSEEVVGSNQGQTSADQTSGTSAGSGIPGGTQGQPSAPSEIIPPQEGQETGQSPAVAQQVPDEAPTAAEAREAAEAEALANGRQALDPNAPAAEETATQAPAAYEAQPEELAVTGSASTTALGVIAASAVALLAVLGFGAVRGGGTLLRRN